MKKMTHALVTNIRDRTSRVNRGRANPGVKKAAVVDHEETYFGPEVTSEVEPESRGQG